MPEAHTPPRDAPSAALRRALRALAADTQGIDLDVYARFGKDPLEPILGHGDPAACIAFFGRDPGRDEVEHGEPFIGAGGQFVRRALYERLHGAPLPDFEASRTVGRPYFWANTVPYKPLGNKAWSERVKQRYQPLVQELLLAYWRGQEVITLGREAFLWFGIAQPRAERARLDAFWASEQRFTVCIDVERESLGHRRLLRLHPLPHPSPLNATWYRRFPGLLRGRLESLGTHSLRA